MTGKDIGLAASLLRSGKLAAIPTETVYGLAGNAFDENAVLSIFKAKGRPAFDPLIVHSDSIGKIRAFVKEIPDALEAFAEKFWPGPLTLILEKEEIIPDLVTSGLDTVAVRIPAHPLTLELLRSLDFPLAAPSANPFGYISPTSARHVEESLGDRVDYILDGGDCVIGIESTIIRHDSGGLTVLRLGGMPLEELRSIEPGIKVMTSSSNPAAPGMLESHYAPSIKLVAGDLEKLMEEYRHMKIAVLNLDKDISGENIVASLSLSPRGDLDEAAKNLFAYMRRLDRSGADMILADLMPEKGLGAAINDRLKRASAK